jgi:hypothetical protein
MTGASLGTVPAGRAAELVVGRAAPISEPLVRFRLGPADRALVVAHQILRAGTALLERVPDAAVAELELRPGEDPPAPGALVDEATPLRLSAGRTLRFEGHGRVLYLTPARRLRAAVGRHPQLVASPVAGTVATVEPGGITVIADGLGLPGSLAAGQAAHGRLTFAVGAPDAELAAAAIDVSGAGAILVGGARVDLEALGRARAMGVRGVVVGGLASRDLRGFLASEARQRAAVHGGAPFAVLVLDGYGKRAIPASIWEGLQALEGSQVSITIDPPLLLLGAEAAWPRPGPDRVRVAAGDLAGREGSFLGWAGRARGAAGVEQAMGRVLLDPVTAGEAPREGLVALADLERLT